MRFYYCRTNERVSFGSLAALGGAVGGAGRPDTGLLVCHRGIAGERACRGLDQQTRVASGGGMQTDRFHTHIRTCLSRGTNPTKESRSIHEQMDFPKSIGLRKRPDSWTQTDRHEKSSLKGHRARKEACNYTYRVSGRKITGVTINQWIYPKTPCLIRSMSKTQLISAH